METSVALNHFGFIVVLAVLVAALAGIFFFYVRRSPRAASSCADLLKRLRSLDADAIALVAKDAQGDTASPLEPEDVWPLLGGLSGMEAMQQNCAVLVELAFVLQTWHPEAVLVAEQLRLNAREIEWHLNRLKGAAQTGHLKSAFPEYAQRAAATYYGMTQTILALYQEFGVAEYADVRRALQPV